MPIEKAACKKNHDARIANTIRSNSCCCCCCSLSFNAFAVWFCVRLCLLEYILWLLFCLVFFFFRLFVVLHTLSECVLLLCPVICLNTLNASSQMMRAHAYNAKKRWLMAHTVNDERCIDLFALVYFALLCWCFFLCVFSFDDLFIMHARRRCCCCLWF